MKKLIKKAQMEHIQHLEYEATRRMRKWDKLLPEGYLEARYFFDHLRDEIAAFQDTHDIEVSLGRIEKHFDAVLCPKLPK